MPSTSTSPTLPLSIQNAKATLEPSADDSTARVLTVGWDISPGTNTSSGEWVVEWDAMYAALSTDLNSARSEKGSYFALQLSSSSANQTPNALSPQQRAEAAWLDRQVNNPEDLPTAPLSTAKLLQFENGGLDKLEPSDDLPGFFSARPIVQAPTHILGGDGKGKVYFLLTGEAKTPDSVKILFYPTWTPPVALAEVDVVSASPGTEGHTAWAQHRLADLKTLEDIARELEREGARGLGTGRVKVGVEGGGMDEEAVRREGWMVGEEMLQGGLKLITTTNIAPFQPSHVSPLDEDGEDLFALPLSPRSPDMAKSPFSRFRGDALGKSPSLSKLSMVENFEDEEKEKTPTGMGGLGLGLGIMGAEGGFPPTPPSERKARAGKE
ncbi:hypothetical protein L873DRAFT_349226 [Choiromyces venosus 120613-1]|uniref:Uncharacterized protein n=1 Tax=Choiromyces venosus 120613-1 TaxID=1336337 RepID=A0A3N4IYW6_9PEZI|nr:hypothetical protein L873DRAFT_349226 [Choiromyces venosus 120613-1]